MKDQVDSLQAAGVPARHIDSSLTDAERVQTFNELRAKRVRLLFVSPGTAGDAEFPAVSAATRRAHRSPSTRPIASATGATISGPNIGNCARCASLFPAATFHGYTATATERVRTDIVEQLGLRDPEVLVGNFDRPNLCYRVLPRTRMLDQIVEVLERHAGEAGIIYCIRRKDVDR